MGKVVVERIYRLMIESLIPTYLSLKLAYLSMQIKGSTIRTSISSKHIVHHILSLLISSAITHCSCLMMTRKVTSRWRSCVYNTSVALF